MIRLGSKIILLHTAQSYSFCILLNLIVIVIFVLRSTQVTIKEKDEMNHKFHKMVPHEPII